MLHDKSRRSKLCLMRFFNLSAAEQDLINGASESQTFAYAFWTVVLGTAAIMPFEDLTVHASEYFFGVTDIAIAAVGFRQCFCANGGNNGNNFLPRMACLGWVVGWRTFVPFSIVALAGWIVIGVYTGTGFDETFLESREVVLFDGILFTLAEITYWSFLKKSVRDVKRRIEVVSG